MKKFLSITLVLALLFNLNAYAGWGLSTKDTFGKDATCRLSALLGIATLESINGSNNNKMTFDLETTAKRIDIYGNDAELRFRKSANDAFDSVQYYDGSAYNNNTTEAGSSWGTDYYVLYDTNDKFYCGDSDKFSMINFFLRTTVTSSTISLEYSKGGGSWGTLTVTDGTNAFTQSGQIIFTPPLDWATDTVNSVTGKYWVRISASAISGSTKAYVTIPTNNHLIQAYANANDTIPAISIDYAGNLFFGTLTPKDSCPIAFGRGVYFGSNSLTTKLRTTRVSQYVASNTAISNGGTIPFSTNSNYNIQVSGNGGPITLSATSAIQDGVDVGDEIRIIGTSDTNKVTIPDNANTQNVGNASIELGLNDSIPYRWNGTDWIQNGSLINV